MADLAQLVQSVLDDPVAQETDWLEWKSQADLSQRLWQARVARFILAAANQPRTSVTSPHAGRAFLLLGVEPGQAHGTNVIDPAVVEQGLARFLGTAGPAHSLDYIAIETLTVAVITVPQPSPGTRPYLARGTFSADRVEIQDGRIYVRRSGLSAEASAVEIDEMLADRVAVRVAAGPIWPMQAEPAWRDGDTIHVQQRRGDRVVIHGPDGFTNLSEMAAIRPVLPSTIPGHVTQRVAIFDSLFALADTEPFAAIEAAWAPLRAIAVEVYEQRFGSLPFQGFKVIDMAAHLADDGAIDGGWVDVAYPLYYWSIDELAKDAASGVAKTYVTLAKALATALLLATTGTQAHREE